MKKKLFIILVVVSQLIYLRLLMAQGIGEYGRVLGGVPRGSGGVSRHTPGLGIQQGGGGVPGVGDVGGYPLPARLVVAAKVAPLYSRQDDETHQIEKLSQGDLLVPMMQSTGGGTEWYMVKTQKGVIGWIKSSDVKEQEAKKP